MRNRDWGERRLTRPAVPDDVRRLPWSYLAAFLASLVALISLAFAPVFSASSCGEYATLGCSLGVGLLVVGAGYLLGLSAMAWVFRLGWLYVVVSFAAVLGVLMLFDVTQSLLVVIGLLLVIPAVAGLASITWKSPRHGSWQFWVALAGSAGVTAGFVLWLWGP